jgi:carboxypeptidase Taq
MRTDSALADLLARAEEAGEALDDWQAANLREMRRNWHHATAVPADLVAAAAKANAASEMRWRTAREDDDFEATRPHLSRLIELANEVAQAKAAAFGLAPYDALLDGYEAGLRRDGVEPLFAELAAFLPDFLDGVLERQTAAGPLLPLPGPFLRRRQRALGEALMTAVGFDFEHGRLDESHHPFSAGVPEDARITTRYTEDDFQPALMAVLHETGHALYSRNLPPKWRYQPVGGSMGMVVHESQSLIVEMLACRSDAYLGFLAPRLAEAFEGSGPAWEPANLARHARQVTRGLIRVDADEVTYPLHVILRYRLEQALLSGDLPVADLPTAWNDAMARLVGIRPPDDCDGCMQDAHWYGGSFGYFPTYTLGALAAAQLFETAARTVDIDGTIGTGDFGPFTDWLCRNVHRQGRRFAGYDALLEHATGNPLSAAPFRRHLEARYGRT